MKSNIARVQRELTRLNRENDRSYGKKSLRSIDAPKPAQKGPGAHRRLGEARAALAQLSQHADATAPALGDASAGPALSDTFLAMRREALLAAQATISAKAADVQRAQAEAVALRQSLRWRADVAPAAPAEYAIPFWYVKWRREHETGGR